MSDTAQHKTLRTFEPVRLHRWLYLDFEHERVHSQLRWNAELERYQPQRSSLQLQPLIHLERHELQPGYQLQRHRIHFRLESEQSADMQLPVRLRLEQLKSAVSARLHDRSEFSGKRS